MKLWQIYLVCGCFAGSLAPLAHGQSILAPDSEPALQLLRDLDEAGERQKAQARAALNASPRIAAAVTHKLILPPVEPTRDCLAKAEVACLMTEAMTAAMGTEAPRGRDWAWLDLAEAQLALGYGEDSLQLAGQLDDPRLVVVLIAGLALDRAASGDIAGALGWIASLPDPLKRAETLVALADAALRRKADDAALAALGELWGLIQLHDTAASTRWLSWRVSAVRLAARLGQPIPTEHHPDRIRVQMPVNPSPVITTDLARTYALLGDLTAARQVAAPLGPFRGNTIGTAMTTDLVATGRLAEARLAAAAVPEAAPAAGALLRVVLAELKQTPAPALLAEGQRLLRETTPGAREALGPELALQAASMGDWQAAGAIQESLRDALGRMATAWRLALLAPTPELTAKFQTQADLAADNLPEGGMRVAALARIARAALEEGTPPERLTPVWQQARLVAMGVLAAAPRARAFGQLALLVNLLRKTPEGLSVLRG